MQRKQMLEEKNFLSNFPPIENSFIHDHDKGEREQEKKNRTQNQLPQIRIVCLSLAHVSWATCVE